MLFDLRCVGATSDSPQGTQGTQITLRSDCDRCQGFGFALRPVLDPFFSESPELARPAEPELPDDPPEPEELPRGAT